MKHGEPLSREMLTYSRNRDWLGNIRELSNRIARHVLMGTEARIAQEPVASQVPSIRVNSVASGTVPLKQIAKEAVRDRERNFILEALQANQWNRRKTAAALKSS